MGISFQKEDPIIERLPTHVANIEGSSAVRSEFDLAPHAEGRGALAPHIGMLASLQGSPQDLMYGDQGTSHVLPVPLLRRCGTLETQGGSREKAQHHEIRSTHPYSSMEVDAPEKVIGLCSGSMEGYLHSSIQSSLDNDVSLHGDIFEGRSPRSHVGRSRHNSCAIIGEV